MLQVFLSGAMVYGIMLSIYSCVCVCRSACFRLSIQDIENIVSAMLRGQVVGYQHHIGGGHYVSVTSGFDCVDFRKLYV